MEDGKSISWKCEETYVISVLCCAGLSWIFLVGVKDSFARMGGWVFAPSLSDCGRSHSCHGRFCHNLALKWPLCCYKGDYSGLRHTWSLHLIICRYFATEWVKSKGDTGTRVGISLKQNTGRVSIFEIKHQEWSLLLLNAVALTWMLQLIFLRASGG